jgi:hypothetical protein
MTTIPEGWREASVIKANGTILVWDCVAGVYRSEDETTYTPDEVAERAERIEILAR